MIKIPEYIKTVMHTLADNGYEAYIVGGCVRDSLLGLEPSDYDVTTNATPDAVRSLFEKTFDTGIKHGTVTVVVDKNNVEVTTYRVEMGYKDSRHPDKVEFVTDLKADLSRRDFTINAMAYNDKSGIVDVFGGREDLKNGVVRTVGKAVDRFGEDALRIMRAFRFSSRLGFEIEEETLNGIIKMKDGLLNISKERIREELSRIVVCEDLNVFRIMFETGVLGIVLPELEKCFLCEQNTKYHMYNVGEHSLKAMENSPKDYIIRWALLLHDIGKPQVKNTDEYGTDHFKTHEIAGEELAREVLNRLKFSNADKHNILTLVRWHNASFNGLSDYDIKKILIEIGKDNFERLLIVKKSDCSAKNPEYADIRICDINRAEDMYKEICKRGEPVYIKDLALSGTDITDMGFSGEIVGDILHYLHEKVLKNPDCNTKKMLREYVEEYAEENDV